MKLKDVYNQITTDRLGSINEAGLSRLLQMAQERDFCIATGFRHENSLQQNRANNKQINSLLSANKMGGYSLIGHWQEAPEGADYHDTAPEDMTDSIEESILFTRPEFMSIKEFITFCMGIGTRFHQDAVIIDITGSKANKAWTKNKADHNKRGSVDLAAENIRELSITEDESEPSPGIYLAFRDGSLEKIGNSISIGKISQAYSQMKSKPEIPFIFEGVLQPTNNISKQAFSIRNIKYLV